MIRSIFFSKNAPPKYDLTLDQIGKVIHDGSGLLWVSLEHTDSQEQSQVMRDTFHFHPLAIEDCLGDDYQTPKVDDYTEHIFVVAHALLPDHGVEEFRTSELDIFLGRNYLVTSFGAETMPPVQTLWRRLERDERLTSRGIDFLFHATLDILVDGYQPLLDDLDDEIDQLEDRVLAEPAPETLERILTLKHNVLILRRTITPLREVTNRLSRDEFTQIDRQTRIYFRDIYDHLMRYQDLIESVRDIVSGALDIYLTSTSNRLNQVMKTLTIVSTIFLPLTFLTGVYGTNFKYFPELGWHYGILYLWGLFLLVTGVMVFWFRRRGWF